MKKSFKPYVIGWFIALVLFNVAVFVTPRDISGITAYDGSFWKSYALITGAFLILWLCARAVHQAKFYQKAFIGFSPIAISVTALIVIVLAGSACMALEQFPQLIGIIICYVALAVCLISMIFARVPLDAVEQIDKKVKAKTLFIRMLTADSEALVHSVSDPDLVDIAKKVYEAVRYSDPMSDEALEDVESRIGEQFSIMSEAMTKGNIEAANVAFYKFQRLLNERNAKCKALK